jgi:hypothetical protein
MSAIMGASGRQHDDPLPHDASPTPFRFNPLLSHARIFRKISFWGTPVQVCKDDVAKFIN